MTANTDLYQRVARVLARHIDGCDSLLDAATRAGVVYGHGSSAWTGEQARAFAHMYAVPGAIARAAAEPAE